MGIKAFLEKRVEILKRHPFAVEAFFRRSLVLAYAVPASALTDLLDPGLELDTYDDYGFLAIALVQTERLRPQGFPSLLGRNFFLSGYRIFTRFVRPGKPTLRGLRILRSDTDRRMMSVLGNVFTHYNYHRADVSMSATASQLDVTIRTPGREADLRVTADLSARPAALPETSPFRSLQDSRNFAGPLPFTFSYNKHAKKMVIIKGIRKVWTPEPVRVTVHEASYLLAPRFKDARLANAFYLENVPYLWKPGTLESLE